MIEIISDSEKYRAAWDKYVNESSSAAISHLWGWKNVMEKGLGHKPIYLTAKDGGRIVGILPMALVRTWWNTRYLISLPWIDYGGICADSADVIESLNKRAVAIARERHVAFIEYRSINSYEMDMPTRRDKVTFRLNLNPDFNVVWNGFDAKLRNQIRKAEKSGLTTELGGIELLPSFYKIFQWKMRDLGTPVWGYKFFESILTEFPDSAKIILVKLDKLAIGGGLVLSFKKILYVPSAASYNEHLKYCPNHALYWNVIKMGCEQGYEQFDFGRSTWNSPTFNFKKQWAGEPIQLNWQYMLVGRKELPSINPDNPKYKLFIKAWKKLPLFAANYLGPKVIRNFP
jgi:FemAB-related protein (PEP-CTERM system-associated)